MSEEDVERALEVVLRTLGELLEEMDQTTEIVSRSSTIASDNARLTIALLGRVLEFERRIAVLEKNRKN